MEKHFKLISPVYNAEEWIGKCIQSVKDQTHTKFTQIIVDDCSTDKTIDAAKEAIGDDPRFVIIEREDKTGALHGHILAGEYEYSEDDYFVHLDGDDWFSDEDVLARLDKIYEDENIWCTYGNYKTTDGISSVCKPVEDPHQMVRLYLLTGWIFSQIRSFRGKLWRGLTDEDFRANDGSYLAVADVAVFCPILEMAGLNRVRYVPEVQMIYNRETNLNDDKVNRSLVIDHALQLAQKNPKDLWKS
jgi:glycosyltransferase involved in cell wall biosynthesis